MNHAYSGNRMKLRLQLDVGYISFSNQITCSLNVVPNNNLFIYENHLRSFE